MSWTFGSVSTIGNATPAPSVTEGPGLVEISTEALGFLSIAGETKLRLLPQAWPSDRLPPNTASLLSTAPTKGLIAAAGPESLILATTESVRRAYKADAPADNGIKPFTPQATIPIPRVSQVAFSSDGSCLVIAAEEGGGLAVYDVQALLQGSQGSAFQMATNGVSVRALVPNPATDAAHFFAVILSNGQLMLANMKDRSLVSGTKGQVFGEGVSCVAWSAKGKQMVAGLEDGTAAQYDYQGNVKAQVPKPALGGNTFPMTCIYWLANDDFLTIHTPVNGDSNDSKYTAIHRDKSSGSFTTQEFTGDPTPAFGMRSPAHHFIARLKDYPPNLQDLLILSSTAGLDIGVFTRSAVPLATDMPADQITNVFTTTSMANDARRAQMPMSSNGMDDTSPIGMVLDLSATENVNRPILGEELEETSTPLPALMLLNNEGVLSTWWVVYSDAVRAGTAYPGLVAAGTQATPAMQSAPFGQPSTTPASALGAPSSQATPAFRGSTPAFGSSTFGKPSQPTFGSTGTPGFGGSSAMGQRSSPWDTPGAATSSSFGKTAFGQSNSIGTSSGGKPAFGQSTPIGQASGNSAFGAPSGVGSKGSVWGSPAPTSQAGGAAFGQTSTPFGASSAASGFAKFGAQGNAALAGPGQENKPSQSPFAAVEGNKPATSPFAAFGGSDTNKPSPFALFGQQTNKPGGASFGSTFSMPSTTGSSFATIGGSFGAPSTTSAVTSPWGAPPQPLQSATSAEATMEDDEPVQSIEQDPPKPSPFGNFKLGSTLQGDGGAKTDLPPSKDAGKSMFGSDFGKMLGETAKDASKGPVTPIKKEPGLDEPKLQDISTTPASPPKATQSFTPQDKPAPKVDDAPLPPDFTKFKPAKPLDDAPLPPDFTKSPAQPVESDAPLPPDFITPKPPKPAAEDLPPIAGSPPVDLGQDSSPLSPPAPPSLDGDDHDVEGPNEESEDWEDESPEDDEDEDEEDEGEDDDEDEDEGEEDEEKTPAQKEHATKNASGFGSRLTFPAQISSADHSAKSPAPSTTPAGFPKGPIFAPPTNESPRSPSPVRAVSTPAGRLNPAQPAPLPPGRTHSRTSSRPASSVQSQGPSLQPSAPAVPETGELEDDEDQRIRDILQAVVEPTKTLDSFVAHHDYVGNTSKPGLGGQVETVYRDINSMIDTLGLNARSLDAFVQGHEESFKDAGRERSDLEDAEDWCLVEIEDLNTVEQNLGEDLEDGRVENVREKLTDLRDVQRDTARLRMKAVDMKKHIAARTDPEQRAAQRDASLDDNAQAQQTELRQAVAKVQKLLQETEEALSMLRADLASVPAASPAKQRAAPTVEAVTNTILKMTAMIEQKSGDVDVLEAQIRRLPRGLADLSLDSSNTNEEDLLRSSVRSSRVFDGRASSPFVTPAAQKRATIDGSQLGLSGMLGHRFRTPPTARRSPASSSVLGQSVGGSGRKKGMGHVTAEEVERYNAKIARRKRVLAAMRDTVDKKGPRIIGAGL